MRRTAALILGGGPAGSAAAITLARAGIAAELFERRSGPHDVVCGGFLGWDALPTLARLGIDAAALGARPIHRLRLVSRRRSVETALPRAAAGLSRRTLDEALLGAAEAAGAKVSRGRTVRSVAGCTARMDDGEDIEASAMVIATGKYELRGAARPTNFAAEAVGLRSAIAPSPGLTATLAGVIELHLFDGGYAGLLLQEDGRANLCLSASRARMKTAGGAEQLIAALNEELPAFRTRLQEGEAGEWSAVAGVPYGWRATGSEPGLYRVGDQAAVIASLAGDGIAIALLSGIAAGEAVAAGRPADEFQKRLSRRVARPVAIAERLRWAAERERPREALLGLLGIAPGIAGLGARLTRVGS